MSVLVSKHRINDAPQVGLSVPLSSSIQFLSWTSGAPSLSYLLSLKSQCVPGTQQCAWKGSPLLLDTAECVLHAREIVPSAFVPTVSLHTFSSFDWELGERVLAFCRLHGALYSPWDLERLKTRIWNAEKTLQLSSAANPWGLWCLS